MLKYSPRQMNLNRHKYHLFASFFQGNMISEKENQVEFEVSVGDYGNKFSPQSDPAPSTTQPCNPGTLDTRSAPISAINGRHLIPKSKSSYIRTLVLNTSNNRKFPVYDGTQYHFMPWSRTKPTVILHSEWEDADYRVGALNILIWMRDFMVTAVFSFWDFV